MIHFAGDGQPSTCIFWKFQFLPIEIVFHVHLEFDLFFLMILSCEHGLSCWKPVSFSGQITFGIHLFSAQNPPIIHSLVTSRDFWLLPRKLT